MQQRVSRAVVAEVKWEKENGRMQMQVNEEGKQEIEADLILLAMGFVHPVYEGLLEELEISINERKNIDCGPEMNTSQAKVFAAGDAVNGASLVVTAIASGRRAARKIDDFLSDRK